MFGWTGKILAIDLTSKKYSFIYPDENIYLKYVGGKGIAGYYLKDHITKPWDSESMPLLFFTGPLVNTQAPTSGRTTVMSRSPLTGTIGDTSVGGTLGSQIKKAGLDGIIITGKSEKFIGIEINDSSIEFINAEPLKGLLISDVHKKVFNGGSVASIGPAAENGVLFSTISIDNHYMAGRNGLGLVMAAKNLKYISVKGSGTTAVYDKNELLKAREDIFRLTAASPALQGEFGLANFGTAAIYDLMHLRKMMPTDNFRKTRFENAANMNAWHFKQQYKTKKDGCRGCHILCKKIGEKKDVMPEFETLSHFSALIENTDAEAVVKANKLCNDLGMDTISAGATISCYKEISGKKISPDDLLNLLNDIGYSKNEGAALKLGSFRYAESKGQPHTSMTVKKLELPGYDPRGAYGMALAYATSTRGACHLRAYTIAHEILRKPVLSDRFSFSGKARIIKISEDMNAMVDSLTACKFIFFAATLEEYAHAYSAVTGIKSSAQDLLNIGERIYYNEWVMNAMNGFSDRDVVLPERFFNEPGSSGEGVIINPISKEEFQQAKENYYKIRGLDSNGMPTYEKQKSLGLL
ncbi:MAG: aldehyde ferredoxin oxidoreductase [Bacteroidetes bacterium GWF2_38_335]|nr:MAG: aldehyde ferredoxin oxidoreductase [Bacteroidetes bacterium GWF2_38_335]OFY77024.1 MAG: aldehyde ferredoxin oxidoreductase [Bacteroidetes bacterium RIFOXYA12_FULL_38_20]HBS86882.1 aldehyde ferredoxin oxidoreductase [Bacteroidales bacterium]